MSKYYKAVRIKNGKLLSAFITQNDAEIEYKENEWVYPKLNHPDYGIFVSTQKNALKTVTTNVKFCQDTGHILDSSDGILYAIYECDVILAEDILKPSMSYDVYDVIATKSSDIVEYNPDSTLLVKACKLNRRLTEEELMQLF